MLFLSKNFVPSVIECETFGEFELLVGENFGRAQLQTCIEYLEILRTTFKGRLRFSFSLVSVGYVSVPAPHARVAQRPPDQAIPTTNDPSDYIMKESTVNGAFVCTICGYKTKARPNVFRHVRGVHLKDTATVRCKFCGREGFTEDTRQQHLRLKHEVKMSISDIRTLHGENLY